MKTADVFQDEQYEITVCDGSPMLIDFSQAKSFDVLAEGEFLHSFDTFADAFQFARARNSFDGPRCVIRPIFMELFV